MHYRNGREAKNGDTVLQLDSSSSQVRAFGRLAQATPGNDYCNGVIETSPSGATVTACLCDCLHIDDVADMLKEKGLDKRPVGK